MAVITEENLIKAVGAIAVAYALYPFLYSSMDNIKNTGNAAVDDVAESVHDGIMKFATFFTIIQAVVAYLIVRFVLNLLPLEKLGVETK